MIKALTQRCNQIIDGTFESEVARIKSKIGQNSENLELVTEEREVSSQTLSVNLNSLISPINLHPLKWNILYYMCINVILIYYTIQQLSSMDTIRFDEV